LLLTAATLKAIYPISYADFFAAALAVLKRGLLLTGDPEFRKLEKEDAINSTLSHWFFDQQNVFCVVSDRRIQ